MTVLRLASPGVRTFAIAAAVAACVTAGCGGSSKSSASTDNAPVSSTTPTPAATGTAPADPTTAEAQIKSNWHGFFAYSTPVATSQALLENGAALAPAIAFAKQEQKQTHIKQGAKVTTVTFTSPTQASVTYQLLNGKAVLLPAASGTAVLQDGSWKVSKQTFCTLVQLGANGKTVPGC